MRNKLYLFFLSIILSMPLAQAQVTSTVHVITKGTLGSLLGSNLKTVTDLTITGTINATDFTSIKSMSALKNLNMGEVVIDDGKIPNSAFSEKVMDKIVLPEGLKHIGTRSFYNASLKEKLVLPSTLEFIGWESFMSFTGDIDFSKFNKLTYIARGAFNGYIGSLIDLKGNTEIIKYEKEAFYGYAGHVILPLNMEEIGESVFSGFKGSVVLPEGLKHIGTRSFYNASLKEKLVLPSTLEFIGWESFMSFTGDIDFSKFNKLTYIARGAFNGYIGSLIDLKGNTEIIKYEKEAFYGYAGHVILPLNTEEIGESVFSGFKGSVVLPEGLRKIDFRSFYNASLKEKLALPSTLEFIGWESFLDLKGEIDFNKCNNVSYIAKRAFCGYTGREIDLSDKLLISRYEKEAFSCYSGHVILPLNTEVIGESVFSGFKGSVTLPEGLEQIGIRTFEKSTFQSLQIPSSVTDIRTLAFLGCTQLTTLTSLNPTPPSLGPKVFEGVNIATCTLYVPKGSVPLYTVADQWKDFFIKEYVRPIPDNVNLCYVENNTVVSEYKGVRIGEYYWMDSNFNNPTDIPVTKAQIDLAHNTYGMFDKQSTSTDGHTYWNYLGEQKGINNPNDSQIESTLLPEFWKYYGTYYTMNRDRINKLSYVRRFGSIQEKVNGELIGQDTVSHYWDGIRSIIQSKYWDLPTAADVLQLIGMCGHGTMPEVRQYLSYKENEVPVAIVAPGMDWFYPNPVNFGTSTYPSDTFDPSNTNKYGMNMVPNGFRWGVQKDVLTVKNESGFTTLYNVPVDELVGAGLNQALTLPVIDKDKNGMNIESRIFTSFQLGDHPVMSYNEYPSADAIPMRWCRALSDSELGYKLYINQDMTDVNYPGSPMVIYAAMIGNQYTNRKRTGEEILLEKVRKGSVNKADISIIKLGLDEQAPAGYVELPRGYIRGFYVQYILDNPTPPKTVSDLIDIALVNPFLWIAPVGQSRDSDKELRISANEISVSDIIRIYPNPVTEKLNINTNGTVDKVSIYNVSGQQVLSLKNVENSINVSHLSDGVYILRMIVDGQESVHKIMKK